MSSIAFIGLGNMGAPMALNLLKAGFKLRVFDLNPAALQQLAEAGAYAASSALDACLDVEYVISMLPASQHVEALYLGNAIQAGLFSVLKAPTLILDCSTIAAASARKLAQAAAEQGLAFLDAPVSGGTAGAAAATLSFMVGGAASDLARAQAILASMGKNIFHAGGAGAGQVAKICNNMLLGILMSGTAEALALGMANGLDAAVLSDIMSKSSGRNWALELYNPYPGIHPNAPASREYQGGFATDLMLKDLNLANEAALLSKAATPLGEMARNLYQLHSAQGQGGLDFSSILGLYQAKKAQ